MSGKAQLGVASQSATLSSLSPGRLLQRQCACGQLTPGGECEECKKKGLELQRKSNGGRPPAVVPPAVHNVLRSPGQPLDRATRAFMEPRFGHDFSHVRIHSDATAADSAKAISALAYTAGSHVIFGQAQFAPTTAAGRSLLAHELTHVVQQQNGATDLPARSIGPKDDEHERDAAAAATQIGSSGAKIKASPAKADSAIIQRFATSEHQAIGEAAYQAAQPQNTSAAQGPSAPKLDPLLLTSLKDFHYEHATGQKSTYGELVTMADNVASFQLMEEQDKERAGKGFRVPVLSRIWDWVGDQTHYLDLASRNLQHFHPHNFMAWQAYHWTALRSMKQAYDVETQADGLNAEIVAHSKEFDTRQKRARRLLEESDSNQEKTDGQGASEENDRQVEEDLAAMRKILAQMSQKQQKVAELRSKAKSLGVGAMALNGFGDHFLTDAYAGGHIVTPRKDLLENYATKLFGLFKVGGVLHCASIPSLAWHDLDNKKGVRVKDRTGDVWTTYGDDYLCIPSGADKVCQKAPDNEFKTWNHVVKATTISVRHMWESAAGRQPTSLSDVLDLLPAPILDPAVYPSWTPTEWNTQLRYSAGEQIGMNNDAMGAGTHSEQPAEQVPNPKGTPIGSGPLSARATCWNAIDFFSYEKFVAPMLERIRKEYNQRFFTGSEGQVLSSTAEIEPQASVVGHTALGSAIGALAGAGLGYLAGRGVGAVIGGVAGLFGGALIGGFYGKLRKKKETETAGNA